HVEPGAPEQHPERGDDIRLVVGDEHARRLGFEHTDASLKRHASRKNRERSRLDDVCSMFVTRVFVRRWTEASHDRTVARPRARPDEGRSSREPTLPVDRLHGTGPAPVDGLQWLWALNFGLWALGVGPRLSL